MASEIITRALELDDAAMSNAVNRGLSLGEKAIKLIRKGRSLKQVEIFMNKKGISELDILSSIENLEKLSTRELHVFETLDALNEFKSNNNCGSQWIDDNNNFAIYKY